MSVIALHLDQAQEIAKFEQAFRSIGRDPKRQIARALNRSLQGSKAQLSQDIAKAYNVKRKDTKQGIVSAKKASAANLNANIRVSGKRISLRHFSKTGSAKPKRGISVLVGRKRGKYPIEGTFQDPRPDMRAIFIRSSRKGRKIKKLWGPSIPQMINEDVTNNVSQKAEERFFATLHQDLNHQINKALGQ